MSQETNCKNTNFGTKLVTTLFLSLTPSHLHTQEFTFLHIKQDLGQLDHTPQHQDLVTFLFLSCTFSMTRGNIAVRFYRLLTLRLYSVRYQLIDHLTWWARQTRSKSCLLRNFVTTSGPNVYETPRSLFPHPAMSLSGSDHNKSHNSPTQRNASLESQEVQCR